MQSQIQSQLRQILTNQIKQKFPPALMEEVKNELVKLAKMRVPIDTEQLKAAINGKVTKIDDMNYSVEIFVENIGRTRSNISNLALGLILNAGGKNGNALRSKSQTNNPAGSPVANWWTEFVNIDVPDYLKRIGLII